MHFFVISLIAGLCLLVLLLTVFFKAGKKNKKQHDAELRLVQDCGDEGLLRLYEQAESENERDGIVEFIKEKAAREEQGSDDSAAEQAAAEVNDTVNDEAQAPRRSMQGISGVPADGNAADRDTRDSTQAVVGGGTAYGEPGETHMLALETVDWQAIEQELQQRREEESRIMAQNQQIQEVFSRLREVEERLTGEPPAENKQ